MTERSVVTQRKVSTTLSPAQSGLLQRQCACGTHTAGGGECAECSKKKLQRKLSIGATDDPLELEADRVADQVLAAPAHPAVNGTPPRIQRFSDHSNVQMDAAPASVDRALSSLGRPLEPALLQDMGQRFGHDFASVRVHTDAAAEQSARDVNAYAFTVGRNIVFGAGQFVPGTQEGRRLLAHELTHVIQQRSASATSVIQRAPPKIVSSGQQLVIDLTDSAWRQTPAFKGGQTQVVYVLRDAITGEYLKVGKTTVTAIINRFAEYVTAGNKWNRRLVADVWTFRGRSTINVEVFEAEIRAGLEKMGARLPWDNTRVGGTGPRQGRPGQGIPMPKEQSETVFIDEVEQLRVKHAPPNVPPRRGATGTAAVSAAKGEAPAVEPTPAASAAKGKAPTVEPTQVGTEMKVLNAVKGADGSTVAEVEYNFGKNLAKINESLPEGAKLPARIVMRITQNVDGAITAVESLSGQPKALVEALARQTLSSGASSAAGGGGEGAAVAGEVAAGEGAVVAGRGLAKLATGLKIGGWVVFAVVTGYELVTATPAERPKVLVKAGGGLAGGALGSYLVCNAALGLETLGWSLLICAFVAGGAGAFAGSAIAGEVYGDVPGTPLHEALKLLDRKSPNVRVLFNLVMENKNPSFLPVNGDFVYRYMATAPDDLKDYEVIILAGQLANLRHIYVAPNYSRALPTGPGSICPNCHQTNQQLREKQQQRNQEMYERQRQESALEEDRQNRENRLQLLKTAISNLPERKRAPGDKAHRSAPTPLVPFTPQPSPWPDVHAPANAIPPVSQQQGTVCPNCHKSMGENRSQAERFGGFGNGPGGQMTESDMKKLMDIFYAQPH